MKTLSHHDVEMLAEIFPAYAQHLADFSERGSLLCELCHDLLILHRDHTRALSEPTTADAAYLADLEEGMQDLKQDIEIQLRRIANAVPAQPDKNPRRG